MKTIYVAFYGEGAVYGADESESAASPSFWGELQDEPDFAIIKYRVPNRLARRLLDHGTSAQYYSDGYEAARPLDLYDSVVIWENDPADYAECPECNRSASTEDWAWCGGCPHCGCADPKLVAYCKECEDKFKPEELSERGAWQVN